MPHVPSRARIASLALAAVLIPAVAAAPAGADQPSKTSSSKGSGSSGAKAKGTTTASRGREYRLDLVVRSFAVDKRGQTYAIARAASKVRTRDGKWRVRTQKVRLAAKPTSNCRVLALDLDDLQLKLLGLLVNTSEINLRITGDRSGGVLGQLFCQLASGINLRQRVVAARTARSLNRRLKHRPMRVIGLRANLHPAQPKARGAQAQQPAPAPPTCQVLKLILGPLSLDLLGLKVDLFGGDRTRPVVVEIVADPNGGVLGSLFCQLANTGVTLTPKPS